MWVVFICVYEEVIYLFRFEKMFGENEILLGNWKVSGNNKKYERLIDLNSL